MSPPASRRSAPCFSPVLLPLPTALWWLLPECWAAGSQPASADSLSVGLPSSSVPTVTQGTWPHLYQSYDGLPHSFSHRMALCSGPIEAVSTPGHVLLVRLESQKVPCLFRTFKSQGTNVEAFAASTPGG